MAGGTTHDEADVALAGTLEWRSHAFWRFGQYRAADVIVESLSLYGSRLRLLNNLGSFSANHRVRVWIDGHMTRARVNWSDGDQVRVSFDNPSAEFLQAIRGILDLGLPGWGRWTQPVV